MSLRQRGRSLSNKARQRLGQQESQQPKLYVDDPVGRLISSLLVEEELAKPVSPNTTPRSVLVESDTHRKMHIVHPTNHPGDTMGGLWAVESVP